MKDKDHKLTKKTTSIPILEEIMISKLTTNPYQPRVGMDPFKVEALAISISQEGLLQPILVSPNEDTNGYIILAGHRRVQAHKLLQKKTIKALVHQKVDHAQLATISVVENLQREDVCPIENAIIFKRLLDENIFSSQVELAHKISISKSWVSKVLSILKLPTDILAMIREDRFRDISTLTALNKLTNEDVRGAYPIIKCMPRVDAIRYINSIKEEKQPPVSKSMVTIGKNKVTINIKDIDKSKRQEVESLIEKITKILE